MTDRDVRDADVGRCDDCGSDAGVREPFTRTIMLAGGPSVVRVWLCPTCRLEGER